MTIEERIVHATSDYLMGLANSGFANEYGGVDCLLDELKKLVEEWEGFISDEDGDAIL